MKIERMDPEMVEVLRTKSGAERLAISERLGLQAVWEEILKTAD